MAERRSYAGNAALTSVTAGINASATSFNLTDPTGWPDGTTGPFFAVIDKGLSTEEKVKISTRSGTTLNSVTRGQDGTAAVSHSAGATIEHVWVASDADLVNRHAADTSIDDHSQYINNARHDTTARHTPGSVVPASASTASLGTSAAGSAANFSRGDHVHDFPAWTAFTPTWSGFVVGNATVTARALRVGKVGFISVDVVLGTSSSMTGILTMNLPAGWSVVGSHALPLYAFDNGGATFMIGQVHVGTTQAGLFYLDDNAGNPAVIATGVPWTWDSNDGFRFSGVVELT